MSQVPANSIEQVLVLLVEDNPGDARLIREMLSEPTSFGSPFAVNHVETLQAAEVKLSAQKFDIILLDLQLPDSTGLDTLRSVSDVTSRTPIIVLSGMNDQHVTVQAVYNGAQEYIPKNECNPRLLTRLIHYAIERKQIEEKLRYLAMHDILTGLPNRSLLYDRLTRALQRSQRKARETGALWKFAVMMVDLDNFKMVNDTYGHEAGDRILQQVARALESCLRQSDSVGRWGGDEFLVVLEGIHDRSDCHSISQKILEALRSTSIQIEKGIYLTASIGVSLFPDDAEDFETLLRFADGVMYTRKSRRGRTAIQ